MSHHTNHQTFTSPLLAVSANGLATAVPAGLSVSHPLIFTSTGPAGGAELPGSRAMEEREEESSNSSHCKPPPGVGWLGRSSLARQGTGSAWQGWRIGGWATGTPPLPLFRPLSIFLVSLAALAAVHCLFISYTQDKIIPPSQHEVRVTNWSLPCSLHLPASHLTFEMRNCVWGCNLDPGQRWCYLGRLPNRLLCLSNKAGH